MAGRKGRKTVLKTIFFLVLLGIIVYLGIVAFVTIREKAVNTETPQADQYDAIVVLGAQVKPDREPSLQLQWRLDAALKAWEAKHVPIIVCGAQGKDEPATEAEVMKEYLMAQGVTETDVFTDDTSFNTNQNLTNAGRILKELQAKNILIVTSDYHVPRSLALASDMGLEAIGMGSPCKPEFWIKNHFREALAWCKYWTVKYLKVPLE